MFYKSFDDQITRKHGIIIDGWPLPVFENPSSIGSQVELKVLFNTWQSGAAHFHRMLEDEFMSWLTTHYGDGPPLTASTRPLVPAVPLPSTAADHPSHTASTSSSTAPAPTINFVQFDPASPAPSAGVQKKARKTRSDKGKPRKRASQLPGEHVFPATQ